jgi:hypothetical protein
VGPLRRFGDGKWVEEKTATANLVVHDATAHCRESEPSATMRNSRGEVTERLKVLASKASVRETVPWVRIPPSPPYSFSLTFRIFLPMLRHAAF